MQKTLFQTLTLVAIGSLLGDAAATTGGPRRVDAAPASPVPSTCGTSADPAGGGSCCASDVGRGALLAQAERNEAIAEGAAQAGKTPNFLVIFGDDIGQTNVSAVSMGLMGYRTPNIDQATEKMKENLGSH